MTGFARVNGEYQNQNWTWEAKSVNGRILDIRVKLPQGYEQIGMLARKIANKHLKRGTISLSLIIVIDKGLPNIRINRALVGELLKLYNEYPGQIASDVPRLDNLLNISGVVETQDTVNYEQISDKEQEAILESLEAAVAELAACRQSEGRNLHIIIKNYLDKLVQLCNDARKLNNAKPNCIRTKLKKQISELLETHTAMDEDRIAQEVALLAVKTDIREEIDRLEAHCAAARELSSKSQPVGRRFEFLCQELNREANTFCAKSTSNELTCIGLELKAVIDQIREQVQNVE